MTGPVRMFAHQVRFEQLIFWRNPSVVFFTFLFPLLLLAFFAAGGSGASASRVSHNEFLISGLAALAIVSTSFQSLAISLAFHREQGVLKRIRATPLPVSLLIGGKIGSVAIVGTIEVAIMATAGRFIYGIGWPVDPLVFAAVALMAVVAFSAMAICLATLIPNGDAAPAIVNAVYLPMMFVSGVFYSVDSMPAVLAAVGKALPLYHLVEPLRSAYAGAGYDNMAIHIAVLALWAIAGVAYAARSFRWEPAYER